MKNTGCVSRAFRIVVVLFLLVTVLLLASISIHAQSTPLSATAAPTPPAGAPPGARPASEVGHRSGQIVDVLVTEDSSLPYTTYVYTHSDLLIFSYTDGTSFEVYHSDGSLVWSGVLDASEHASLTPGAGVYRALGSAAYSICAGDALTGYVLGYYARDPQGKGLSKLFYTYQSDWGSTDYDPHFIVFAYEDGTNVQVSDTDTDSLIWSGTLDAGERYDNTTIDGQFLTVVSDKAVSALTYTDQGYYVPSENGTFLGIRFYTYVGNAGGVGSRSEPRGLQRRHRRRGQIH